MFKGLLLAGALVALSPLAHAATTDDAAEGRSIFLRVVQEECTSKATTLFAPPFQPSAAAQTFLTIQRAKYEAECVAVSYGPMNAIVDDIMNGKADQRWTEHCMFVSEPSADWRVAPYAMRLLACMRGPTP